GTGPRRRRWRGFVGGGRGSLLRLFFRLVAFHRSCT
ncbi:polyhydroxyalkanoate synthesis protein PhaF, partial [Pseudomonas aeruginosa]